MFMIREAEELNIGFSRLVKIDDLKNFVDAIFPDSKGVVYSQASQFLLEPQEDFEKDLKAVTEDELSALFDECKPARPVEGRSSEMHSYHEFGIRVSGQEEPLVLFVLNKVHYSDIIACSISRVHFEGESVKVESAIEAIRDLFDKPTHYPFRQTNNPEV